MDHNTTDWFLWSYEGDSDVIANIEYETERPFFVWM
jgi:hypothetical protein